MNKQELYELLRLDPYKVPSEIEFWALYATSLYERLFKKTENKEEIHRLYEKMKNNPKLSGRAREALEFFYHLRLDELENPDYWGKVGKGKISENTKAKLVKESLNEYIFIQKRYRDDEHGITSIMPKKK